MVQLMKVALDDNTVIYLEVSSGDLDVEDANVIEDISRPSRKKHVAEMPKNYIDGVTNQIEAYSSAIAKSIKKSQASPDEFEIQFGVKLSLDAGAVFAKIGAETDLCVKLSWKK